MATHREMRCHLSFQSTNRVFMNTLPPMHNGIDPIVIFYRFLYRISL